MRIFWLPLLAICLLGAPPELLDAQGSESTADDEDDSEEQAPPGLVAEYFDAAGHVARRIDAQISLTGEQSPDARVSLAGLRATWRGELLVLSPGEYRLHVFAAGRVEIELDGELRLQGETATAAWIDSAPLDLEFGEHAMEVRYARSSSAPQIALYWSGPQFALEPIPPWHLFHARENEPGHRFERGAALVHALRCGACHRQLAREHVLPAASLARLRGNVSQEWLARWIEAPDHASAPAEQVDERQSPTHDSVPRRMPAFGLTRDESRAIAAYLWQSSDETPPPQSPGSEQPREPEREDGDEREKREKDRQTDEPEEPSAASGATLFRTLGCLACHQVGELGRGELFGGGDLAHVADKRPAEFFAAWLRDPAALNPSHRMPIFALEDIEIAHLAAYLSTLHSTDKPRAGDDLQADADEGKRLLAQHRCTACHATSATAATYDAPPDVPLSDSAAKSELGCLGPPDRHASVPGYALSANDVAAVREYFAAVLTAPAGPEVQNEPNTRDGRLVLAERNCLGCHARALEPGLAASLPAVLESDEQLAPRIAGCVPPALNSVGDKLHDAALRAAITTTSPRLLPWLDVRMPKFNLADDEVDALASMFVAEDRIPARPSDRATQEASLDDASLQLAGSRLVTSAGFGCTSCHAVGEVAPVDVALAARGTDLSELGRRIRHPWYDRWVRNPARIVPRMEMPSVQIPIGGVLDGHLDRQLAAVWHVLNLPDFTPPPPGAIRTVRARNVAGDDRAHLLTDVLEVGSHKYIKPLLIGLPNRHSLLFNLAENRLAGWWIGDVARQRTRGKTWYWEPGGEFLIEPTPGASELILEREGHRSAPRVIGQFPTECDQWEHQPRGLRFEHRLRFGEANGDSAAPTIINVEQEFHTASTRSEDAQQHGFLRRLLLTGVPKGATVRLALAATDGLRIDSDELQVAWSTPLGECAIQVVDVAGGRIEIDDGRAWLVFPAQADGSPVAVELIYFSTAPLDSFPVEPLPVEPTAPTQLDVVPGFTATRLPITDEIMPTGLAWRPDGTLVFTSLKGEVWQARDTNGDGLEDTAQVLSDDLAAPYGVAAIDDRTIDVINKYALLRLFDADGDGHAERTERLASGWGHTHDYHDWAVGLVPDAAGGYYITLPCQQDNRSAAAAHLRGRALRLIPREPIENDPSRFALHEIAAGLRFPMGLAMNTSGDLFATDNQGNYTPFNELNHLVEGQRYGFINRLEAQAGFKPAFQPAAIEIPHPWTRSVNGICFLDTPAAVREQLGRDLFGPFEGHLIGCEYDTRGLVRLSLERIGDTYQGAVYPFSAPAIEGAESLLGPISCAIAPDGDLYIGNLRDSAWGAGANNGSLVRLRPNEVLPPGIAEVRAQADGFELDFTQPVDPAAAADLQSYAVASFRRIPTPDYGGADQDRRTEKILAAEPQADGRSVRLRLPELREGFVYELRVGKPLTGGARWAPAEAYYTLRRRPQ